MCKQNSFNIDKLYTHKSYTECIEFDTEIALISTSKFIAGNLLRDHCDVICSNIYSLIYVSRLDTK